MSRSDLVRPACKVYSDLLIPTSAATPVTIGSDVYLAGGFTSTVELAKVVQVYNMVSGECRELPPSLQYNSTAVAIDKTVVLIGGCDSLEGKPTNMVATWMEKKKQWILDLPQMNTKRYRPGVLLLNNYLFVFGGLGKTCLTCFEFLDLNIRKKWINGRGNLLQPLHSPQLGVFGESVMLCGGFTSESANMGSRNCYTAPVQRVLASATKNEGMYWESVRDPSYFNSTILTTRQRAVFIGGFSKSNRGIVTNAITHFKDDSWKEVIALLATPRILPTVAAVGDRSFLVLGGSSTGDPTKSLLNCVELITY